MEVSEDRVATGIEGFDDLIKGGIPRGSLVLLGGDAGSGKTVFAGQYLYHGVSRLNEPGIYVKGHEEIPDRLDDFQTALGKIRGKGAPVLTRMITRNLCNKIGGCSYHERSDWNLKMYVENCKRRYEEES